MPDCWSEEECWSNYSAVNLSNIGKDDFPDEDHDAEQSINLSDHLVLDHFYMFASVQLEVKPDSKNAHQGAEFFDYISQL